MDDTAVDRVRALVRDAVGDEWMVGAKPHDGLGGVIMNAPESGQALLWIRGGADDDRPALIQAMVPFDDRPIEADDEAIAAAAAWLEASRGRWSPMDPDAD